LWSHKSFKASIGLRWCLSFLGCLGFQGSIKWWVLRHRLHHRWTDSEFDPLVLFSLSLSFFFKKKHVADLCFLFFIFSYNSKKGLFFSHMGWIFRKPKYEKLKLIDQTDLNQDPGKLVLSITHTS
jgi:stearoyl-CoA desaturase (delta-9 desaturase)